MGSSRLLSRGSSQPLLTQADQRKVGERLPACGIDGGHCSPLRLGGDRVATAGSLLWDQLLTVNLEPDSIAHLHAVPWGLRDEGKKRLISPIYQTYCVSQRGHLMNQSVKYFCWLYFTDKETESQKASVAEVELEYSARARTRVR